MHAPSQLISQVCNGASDATGTDVEIDQHWYAAMLKLKKALAGRLPPSESHAQYCCYTKQTQCDEDSCPELGLQHPISSTNLHPATITNSSVVYCKGEGVTPIRDYLQKFYA